MFSYGFDMDRWIKKRKWRGERKEASEIKKSGTHAFSYGFGMGMWIKRRWRGERKDTSEINNSGKHAFPMVLKWKG